MRIVNLSVLEYLFCNGEVLSNVFLYLVLLGYFFNNYLLSFFLLGFLFSSSNNSWEGSFFIMDGSSFVFLVLVFHTFLFIWVFSLSYKVLSLSGFLVLLSIFFFTSPSFLWFYILLEASLVPLLILLLGFGSQVEKVAASYYLVLYTMMASFPFLFMCSFSFMDFGVSLFLDFNYVSIFNISCYSLLFLVKFPLYSMHLWLPKVHVESPSESSILLASLLLKMGTYGFTRLLSSICWDLYFPLETFCILGMVLCGFIVCVSSDTKSFIAYSSIVHMMFLLYVLLSSSGLSSNSGLLLMVFHGYVSTVLFYIVGELYAYWGTRSIYFSNSLWINYSFFSMFVLVFFLSNSSIPPFMGFFGEVFSLISLITYVPGIILFVLSYYMVTYYYSFSLGVSLLSGKCLVSFYYILVYPLFVMFIIFVIFIILFV